MDEYIFSVNVDEDPGPIWSGLFDARGYPLVRYRKPVGFDIEYLRRQNQAQQTPQGPHRQGPPDPEVP
jgi:hypothetical protein